MQYISFLVIFVTFGKVFTSFHQPSPKVALTREQGYNYKLRGFLRDIECVEVPCIQTVNSQSAIDKLNHDLRLYDVILATSPNVARLLVSSWRRSGCPDIRVAAVGSGTAQILRSHGLVPVYIPPIATGVSLGTSLPRYLGSSVLYPTSSLAPTAIPTLLRQRGFTVKRLDIYTTLPASWSREMQLAAAAVDVVALASPSAANVWHERIGTDIPAVTIGPTTSKRCHDLGFRCVVEGSGSACTVQEWAAAIKDFISKYGTRRILDTNCL